MGGNGYFPRSQHQVPGLGSEAARNSPIAHPGRIVDRKSRGRREKIASPPAPASSREDYSSRWLLFPSFEGFYHKNSTLLIRTPGSRFVFFPANYPTVHGSDPEASSTVSASLDSNATQFGIMFPSIQARGKVESRAHSEKP